MNWIGLDIGGTKVRGVLWNGRRVVRALEFPTPTHEREFVKKLPALVASLARRQTIRGIGIGAAGIVKKTTLIFSPNIPCIKKFDFRRLWPRPLPLCLDNDARCFARAEMIRGAGRGSQSLFGLTIGTGIGRAYGTKGRIIKLKKFEYPENWERKYQAIRKTQNSRKLAQFLGKKLSRLLIPFRPQVVVVGGGVLKHEKFFQMLRAELKTRLLTCKIRRATIERNGAAVGAAFLFKNRT